MSLLEALNKEPVYAVVEGGQRTAFASLKCNATYAAQASNPPGEVVACYLVPGHSADSATEVRLWGFFHTTCVYESAAALVSLHTSKVNAWRAMHRAQWEAWELNQRGPKRGKSVYPDRIYVHERSHIRAIALQD